MDIYDNPPSGFMRDKHGWLRRMITPQDKRLQKLEEENKELKAMLQIVLERIGNE